MEKWIFKNWLSPGDIVMMTAAIRDLHRTYPGRFATDVRTSCPALWENNPFITPLSEDDPEVRELTLHYPLIHRSNHTSFHFIHGFTDYLNKELGLDIDPTEFKGDIHLSEAELDAPAPLASLLGERKPYWLIVAGGKYDYTIKWWHRRRWQQVVDHFSGQITFVQIGELGHYHPGLKNVFDLRGKVAMRELIRLVYHADGVACPVTLLMHLAAAVPLPSGRRRVRSCVVVAGGREPTHWEAYPGHQFLHTIGALDCCASGGCWRSRTVPLDDGSPLDHADHLCVDTTPQNLPRCMDMISASDVARAIQIYTKLP